MPELPDITVYVERLRALAQGQPLEHIRIASPFVLRTAAPGPEAFYGRTLDGVGRLGKRIVLEFQGDLFMVLHLMIAGRLRWSPREARSSPLPGDGDPGQPSPRKVSIPPRQLLTSFAFPTGALLFTEAGSKHRASLHLVAGRDGLAAFRRTGVDFLTVSSTELGAALQRQNRTLKRALTDPDIVDGVGNTYSDEILHRARLSPFKLSGSLTPGEVATLHQAGREVLTEWVERLRAEAGTGFPDKVTAFHPEMAVHGKYGQPCPVCGAPVQRVVYADSEANYCPGCQTGGRVLADRSLSRLLKEDWPRTLEELEQMKRRK